MVHYKVIYFPFRGAAELPRQILTIGGAQFEDVRIARDDFPKHKDEMPFGQMPVLEIDGKKYAQSGAIARYLARQFHLAGKTPLEELQVDMLYEQFRDYQTECRPFFAVFAGFAEGDKDKLYKEVLLPARDKFFGFCKKFLKESGSGYLVGKELTFVDLAVAEAASTMIEYYPDFAANHKEIEEHAKKVRSHPALKKWIETRPKTPF